MLMVENPVLENIKENEPKILSYKRSRIMNK